MNEYNLLFCIDGSYIDQLKTTLLSLRKTSKPESKIHVYIMMKDSLSGLDALISYCQNLKLTCHPIAMANNEFQGTPVSERYPETIYYRLLAQEYLPQDLDRVLYLDADILCINEWQSLFEMDMNDQLYAACSHSKLTNLTNVINKVRLKTYESEGYFNSGVLLMNLPLLRQEVKRTAIYQFINENTYNLLLPDQDVLNALYGERILSLPDEVYNYDVRKKTTYEFLSKGEWTMDWVLDHTVFLHFCGKEKPWNESYTGRFSSLYKYFAKQSREIVEE